MYTVNDIVAVRIRERVLIAEPPLCEKMCAGFGGPVDEAMKREDRRGLM
jgi:hypothetical protein